MYNFDFLKDEELIRIFENIWVSVTGKEKNTTIAITNKRLLFLDYNKDDYRENLRISRGANYMRLKEVYYSINLEQIKNISSNNDYYIIETDNKNIFIDDKVLYELLKKNIKK